MSKHCFFSFFSICSFEIVTFFKEFKFRNNLVSIELKNVCDLKKMNRSLIPAYTVALDIINFGIRMVNINSGMISERNY